MRAPRAPSLGSAWQLVRKGPFARLWWAGVVSSLGDWVALFATLTLAARIGGRTGSAETAILVPLVARMLPGLLIGPLGGVLADRWDRKKTMVAADLGRAVLIASLVFVDDLRSLFAVSVFLELLTLLWAPAKEATVPNLVRQDRLVHANSLSLGAAYGTFPVGSAIFALLAKAGGLTTGLGGPFASQESLAFIVDALTFVAAGFLISRIDIPRAAIAERRRAKGRLDVMTPLRDLVEGARFVVSRRQVRPVVFGMTTALFGGGMVIALGEPYARRVLGADAAGFGALVTALGTGAGLGMISIAAFSGMLLRRDVMFGASLLVSGMALSVAAWMSTVTGALWWIFLLGLGSGAAYVMGFSHLHEEVEDEIRGRTFAALLTLVRTGMLAAIAVAGITAAALNDVFPSPLHNGTRLVLFLGGVIMLTAGAGVLWSVREVFGRPKWSGEALRSVEAASDAFTSLLGERRGREDEEEGGEGR